MKQHSAAAERNAPHILEILGQSLPATARVWEIGSGTGQHAVTFAAAHPNWTWLPSNHGDLESIEAYRAESGLANIAAPVNFDLFAEELPHGTVDAVYSANVLHIAPVDATARLFLHAKRAAGQVVVVYGPFRYADRPLEPSNEDFDVFLAQTYPGGGIRRFEDVLAAAAHHGFTLRADHAMPANNRTLVFTAR